MVYIFLIEPTIFLSQMVLRRGGGLSGSYQFHRLYEIRKQIKPGSFLSGIEFGSGASTLLFKKYLKNFISVEESEEWAKNYIKALNYLNWIPGSLTKNLESTIRVLPRLELLDTTGELVCSYEMPKDISNQKFDLVYIDGPTSWVQGENELKGFIRDVHNLIPNISILELLVRPKVVLIDGRRATVSYLIEKGKFEKELIDLKGSYLKPPSVRPYHTRFLLG